MIHLDVHTGYGFLKSYGKPDQIIDRAKALGARAVGIADNSSTWGHIPFWKAAKKEGIKPIFGVTLNVYTYLEKNKVFDTVTLLAQDADGLHAQYDAVSLSTEQFYYRPRITWEQLDAIPGNYKIINSLSTDFELPLEHGYMLGVAPSPSETLRRVLDTGYPAVLAMQPLYPTAADRETYRLMLAIGSAKKANQVDSVNQWMFSKGEIIAAFSEYGIGEDKVNKWISDGEFIADKCCVDFPVGVNVKPKVNITVEQWCKEGAKKRGVDLNEEPYKSRYEREMEMIKLKGFEDYFLLIGDLCQWSKERMFVGPARGSSAGSLVCWLMEIVEVNPITYGLIFERFIDINREDLPDVDIDFPHERRDEVFEYIVSKYGAERVARIGTISEFKPKSALNDVAKCYSIPKWEIEKLTDVMVDRSGGDARANMAIEDTILQFDVGKKLVKEYPNVLMATHIEGHPRHTGVHAAGVLVSEDDVSKYASINRRGGAYIAMLNKKDCEAVGLLKIDALGLKTLSVIESCCNSIGMDPRDLYKLPTDDQAAFEIFQSDRVGGVFQFEGYAVRSLMRQMGVEDFGDIVALTALARPGPLHCGAANEYIERKTGKVDWDYDIPEIKPHVSHTYGTIVYQEQIMTITRDLGDMSWEDVSELRKAMSKSLGEEFFNKFKDKFLKGTRKKNIPDNEAIDLWNGMCTFGSWAFNLSHAVSYALISYWCAHLKAHHQLEFAVAHLKYTPSHDHVVRLLRELIKEGIVFCPFDPDISGMSWTIKGGKLYGGFGQIKGFGPKTAETVMAVRDNYTGDGEWTDELTLAKRTKVLTPGNTPYSNLHRLTKKYKALYEDPDNYISEALPSGVSGPVLNVEDIKEERGTYTFVGTLKVRNLRDLNETQSLAKRGGKIISTNHLFLNMTFEDDTGSILCTIDRWKYPNIGVPIMEEASDGKDFLIKGKIFEDGRRKIFVQKIVRLDKDEDDDNENTKHTSG